MSKEKLISATKYVESLKNKLADGVPAKHRTRAAQYKAFLEKELKAASTKIENLKITVTK